MLHILGWIFLLLRKREKTLYGTCLQRTSCFSAKLP